MNIVANNIASKLFVAFVAVAMLFTLAAPAKAATAEELQEMINTLLAQVASLQGQVGQGGQSVASGVCPFTWTRSLVSGSTGADVMKLQQFLNADVDTRVSASGVGSVGMETEYFGPATAAAVSKFQVKNGVVAVGTGTFGPLTMAKANMICTTSTPTPGDDSSDDSSDDDSSVSLSGEASLDSFEVSDGEDEGDVEEGSEDVQVAEFVVEFADGDAMITRMDLALQVDSGNNGDDDPWDVFQDVSLWVDGDEVARMDVTDEDDYLDEDNGSLRFSGLDIVGMEDEEVTVVVAVTVNSSVDGVGSSDDENWNIAAGPVRFSDADDVTSTETVEDAQAMDGSYSTNLAEFAIEEAGAGDDLDLESSDEDPDATTIELDEDDNTEAMIFAFDLSADDSDGDIEINEVVVDVVISGLASVDDLVNDFRLEIGGDSYNADSYTGTGSTTEVTFDIGGDSSVAADEVVTAMLYADFENMDDSDLEGSTIFASTSPTDIDAEGVEDVTVDGADVVGETHTLRTEGVSVELTDESVEAIENADAATDDEARFTVEFTVTSFGDTVYLPFGASSSTDLTGGVEFSIIDTNSNAVVSTGIAIASLDMDGEGETNSFKIADGDTETFTLEVTYDPTVSGSYKLRLDDINFALTDAGTATDSQDVSDENIDTSAATITS